MVLLVFDQIGKSEILQPPKEDFISMNDNLFESDAITKATSIPVQELNDEQNFETLEVLMQTEAALVKPALETNFLDFVAFKPTVEQLQVTEVPDLSQTFGDIEETSGLFSDSNFSDDSDSDLFSAYDFSNIEDDLDRLLYSGSPKFSSALAPDFSDSSESDSDSGSEIQNFKKAEVDEIVAQISAEVSSEKSTDQLKV